MGSESLSGGCGAALALGAALGEAAASRAVDSPGTAAQLER